MRFPFSLPRFWHQFRAEQVLPAPDPDDTRPPPPQQSDAQLGRPDRQTILSQWSHLRTLDPKSHDYIELLKRLVDVEANRHLALGLTGKDAGIVIDTIDKGLRGGTLQPKVAHHSFSLLRKLVANTGQLPVSYSVNNGARFRVEEKIFACGGFADVRKGKLNKRTVAVKTIRIAQDTNITKIRKDFSQEAVLWMHTSHSNILELIGVNVDPQNGTFSLISEFMVNGNIMDYIRVNKANRIRLLEDVTKGLRYLHRCEIIHGDLKGNNILIKNGKPPQACISDFGFSTVAHTASFAMPASVDEQKGTWSHMAPELLLPTKFGSQSGRPSKQGDVYAFGMVVYEVLTGRTPFAGEGRWMAEIVMHIAEGKRPGKPENAEDIGFGRGTWELVQRCWHENRDERPAAEEIHAHFQSVARASTVVPPGPTVVTRGTESQITAFEPESRTRDFTSLFVPSSQASANIVRRAKFVAGVVAGGGNLHSAVSVPSVQFIRTKPSLFDRLGARIKGRRPGPRLGSPASTLVRA